MTALFDLTDKCVLITGSSRGIGLTIASEFIEAGACVFVTGIDESETAAAVEDLKSLPGAAHRAYGQAADLTIDDQRSGLLSVALGTIGLPDVLVLNAGIDIIKPALDYTVSEWTRIMDVNASSSFFLAQAVGRRWIDAGRAGSIVMTSSIAGSVGIPTLAPYAASKGAINQMVRTLAVEWAPHDIRVNAVAPGYVETIMDGVTAHDDVESDRRIRQFTPLGRRATSREIAGPVLFLASPAANYITGSVLAVDGGYTAL
jgi:NAD(P)-dependent dehydrogenase (short-subunit alcohol dehydrogenase family)